ncbi:MAG: hypothetical protein AAGL96_09285 [Pseudomonadota bacterium]
MKLYELKVTRRKTRLGAKLGLKDGGLNPLPPKFVRIEPSGGNLVEVQTPKFLRRLSGKTMAKVMELDEEERKRLINQLAKRKCQYLVEKSTLRNSSGGNDALHSVAGRKA